MWEKLFPVLIGYLLIINGTAFLMMGLDKGRARRNQWRISERSLFLPAVLGGSLGTLLGMKTFHHKTKHWYFRFGIPVLLVLQLAAAATVWRLSG